MGGGKERRTNENSEDQSAEESSNKALYGLLGTKLEERGFSEGHS